MGWTQIEGNHQKVRQRIRFKFYKFYKRSFLPHFINAQVEYNILKTKIQVEYKQLTLTIQIEISDFFKAW